MKANFSASWLIASASVQYYLATDAEPMQRRWRRWEGPFIVRSSSHPPPRTVVGIKKKKIQAAVSKLGSLGVTRVYSSKLLSLMKIRKALNNVAAFTLTHFWCFTLITHASSDLNCIFASVKRTHRCSRVICNDRTAQKHKWQTPFTHTRPSFAS